MKILQLFLLFFALNFGSDVMAQEMNVKGTVYDAETKKTIGAKVELIDLKTNQVIQQVYSDKVKGDYLLVLTQGAEFGLYVSAPGYLFKSSFLDLKNPASDDCHEPPKPKEKDLCLPASRLAHSAVLL